MTLLLEKTLKCLNTFKVSAILNTVVEIDNLTKDYEVGFWRKRKVRALDELSLTVNNGESLGSSGPTALVRQPLSNS